MSHAGSIEWRAAVHAALLGGALGLAIPVGAAPANMQAFAPPIESPMLLSRKIVRELSGGAAIVTTRRYNVMFRRVADGWEIDGTLIASEVDAPAALAALAAIERARPDEGLFPIHLDPSGRIVPATTPPGMGRQAVAKAVSVARQFGGSATGAASPGLIDQVAAAAQSPGAGLTRWPEALFIPGGLEGSSEHKFTLSDGSEGCVQVSQESDHAPGLATMSRAARTVVTTAAGTRRVAREEWTLTQTSPLGKP